MEGKSEVASILDGNYRHWHEAIRKCYEAAKHMEFSMFAVQDGGQCMSSLTAEITYDKYGPSTLCNDEDKKGGEMANEVYKIKK